MLARYDAEVLDTLQRRREASQRSEVLGWIALAEGRPNVAVTEFRASMTQRCHGCSLVALGLAFDLSGATDSALFYYGQYDQLGLGPSEGLTVDALWRPVVLRRLGELYEQKGESGTASPFYKRFVEVWKNADPDLQPKVAAARAKLRAFAQTERR
jgi:hypothetical protein